jgi:hypothetical protein
MNNSLSSRLSNLSSAELQVLQERIVGEGLRKIVGRIAGIEDTNARTSEKVDGLVRMGMEYPLFNVESDELQNIIKKTATRSLGGYGTPAYNSRHIRGKVYADIHHQLRREYGVKSYKAIKRVQLNAAKVVVENYTAPTVLKDEIDCANNQVEM